ncbi:MAG: undecaprenyldiphospho-muramoylpentapeptide beta-N-acetylglucosaminyltransferase [Elusimicrobia bacterium RIFCSPLOWO2_01_FULL_64_13]|nr:MAG: undecaprenyldiphospho-muramoylpentapeptide beta-N-acetylglucosaminyltransferase [Elusimicrobia bacterium RIFCSPHIGHO2_01_FULL_64_10]OGR96482.1 MAG: undecaprenyldiphospho-muramoylpentapeptide beta-N-acetylglucosaminyltransferase [Elusimicrobia bacterium RIFCSPLOWO2_01_FULL_64_13]
MRVLIAAGGTGGHLYPALAFAKELKKRGAETLFTVGSGRFARDVLAREGENFVQVPSAAFSGRSPLELPGILAENIRGVFKGLEVLKSFRPDGVAGFGAYVSVPVLLAARLGGVPVLPHEQNLFPGRATRLAAVFSKKVAVSFADSMRFFPGKSVLTGNPVRDGLAGRGRQESRLGFGLDPGRSTLLIFGGSAGARSINDAVALALPEMKDLAATWQVLHIAGRAEEAENLRRVYSECGFSAKVMDYSFDMPSCYAASDLALCRAGATSVAELIATRTPAILIPYPYAAGGHQDGNAAYLERAGAARIARESGGKSPDLASILRKSLSDPAGLEAMRSRYAAIPEDPARSAVKLAGLAESLFK